MSLEDDVQRKNEASQLLNHPLMQEALLLVKQELYDAISTSNWQDKDAREEAYRQLKSGERFEAKLRSIIDNGKIAEKTLLERARGMFS